MPLFLYHQLKITNRSEFDDDFCYLIVTEYKHRKIILNDKPKNQEEDNKGKIKVGEASFLNGFKICDIDQLSLELILKFGIIVV